MYSVNKAVLHDGKVVDWYSRNFATMDDAMDYYHDIDLKLELSIESHFDGKRKIVTKEAFDEHGTQIEFDYAEEVNDGS